MQRTYKRWFCGMAAVIMLLLAVCAVVVYAVDPALYYRMPEDDGAVYFSERFQSAGLIRNHPADTVLIGTSMAANYRAGRIGAVFGGEGLRITVPDSYCSELDQIMDALFRWQQPERVVLALDLNILVRDESGLTGAMPGYLYNDSAVDDVRYLLNKDSLYYSGYVLLSRAKGTTERLDDSFVWDKGIWWDHMTALGFYQRPERSLTTLPPDAYLENVRTNLTVLDAWFREHPQTEFRVFLSPYSMLYWDEADREGTTEALLSALLLTCESLLEYENVSLYGYLMDREFVDDLDNYCDHLHHSTEMGDRLLGKLVGEEERLTKENVRETIANWREFVVNYDYEKFWDDAFWKQWVTDKAAGKVS